MCTLAMPPLVAQVFVPLSTHSSGRLVVDGASADGADVDASVGLRGAERAELGVAGRAEHLRAPIADLLREFRCAANAAAASPVPMMDSADAGVAPEHLLERGRACPARSARPPAARRSRGSKADLRGLLDHRPRGFLALVPFGGGGPDDRGRELVQPVPRTCQVVAQLQREPGPSSGMPPPAQLSYSKVTSGYRP